MRLTDEERRIADDVAMHWAYTLDRLDDAWARALEHIAARRKALGEAETPGTATAAGVGAPRGVVVTAEQRKAVAVAASVYRVTGWQEVADELDGLLDAIDAAKGGGA